MKLMIGNKRYSSWSLRPWLLMRQLGIDFQDEVIPYFHVDWHQRVAAFGAGRTVPLLIDGDIVVNESIAIVEYLHERFPQHGIWPQSPADRARARSLSAEVHAGFGALRQEYGFDAFRDGSERPLSAAAAGELARLEAIWNERLASGQEFLFGGFSAADAMFAPFAVRIHVYGLRVSGAAEAYVKRLLALPAMREWFAGAEAERSWPDFAPGAAARTQVVRHADALDLAKRWVAAWNARDLPAVLALFSPDAAFRSPKAASIAGSASLKGVDALQSYWSRALQQIGDLHFDLQDLLWDPMHDSVVVRYHARLNGHTSRSVEIWQLNAAGQIVDGEALYGAAV